MCKEDAGEGVAINVGSGAAGDNNNIDRSSTNEDAASPTPSQTQQVGSGCSDSRGSCAAAPCGVGDVGTHKVAWCTVCVAHDWGWVRSAALVCVQGKRLAFSMTGERTP